MGSSCSAFKTGGESYSLTSERHNRVQQEPQESDKNTQHKTAVDQADLYVYHDSRHRPAKQTVNNLDVEESSSSKDVNLQVAQEEKSRQISDESEVRTKEVFKVQNTNLKTIESTMESSNESKRNETGLNGSQKVVKAGHAKTSEVDFSKLSNMTEEEADDIVNECWKTIEETCDVSQKTKQELVNTTGWRVVRLFVSSTFTDYHAERELLVKKVKLTNSFI
jgi:hypothetical protein